MHIFRNIKEWYYTVIDNYKQYYKDKKMYNRFIGTIKEEANDRDSDFNAFNLRYMDSYTKVIQIIDIPEEYQLKGQLWQIMDKLNESSYFVGKYLREKLMLGDNVSRPEYFHIEDPSDPKPLSCRYMASWTYVPVLKSKTIVYVINTLFAVVPLLCILGGLYIILS